MAERKSVNKYYPPDWDPSKGSVNNYVGQHPLRDRAKKLGQGILVIRFEMPYNIWCGGCNAHIGMGVRYNAEKSKTGKYYSTPIYKFRMKCHLCDNYFEIQTDPKNHDYVILEGARRKEQRWDPKENEQIVPEDKATQKKLATDPMFKLEHGTDDRQRGKKAVSSLAMLEVSKEGMKDDYILNKIARNKFREEKKSLKKVQEDDDALLKKSSLDIPLLKEKEEDVKLAGLIRLRAIDTYDEKQVQKRKEIGVRPIFESRKRPRTDDTDTELPQSKKLKIIRDNILKAKVNSSTNPFDRMKTSTAGFGLTKNQLGIRMKTMKTSKSLNDLTDTIDNKITSGGILNNSMDHLTNHLDKNVTDNNVNRVDNLETGSDRNSRLESISITHDTIQMKNDIKGMVKDPTDDSSLLEGQEQINLKKLENVPGEMIKNREESTRENCVGKSTSFTECTEQMESPRKSVMHRDKCHTECNSKLNNNGEENSDLVSEVVSKLDRSDRGVDRVESVSHEQINASVHNTSSDPQIRTSLVAAYSDSEDTD